MNSPELTQLFIMETVVKSSKKELHRIFNDSVCDEYKKSQCRMIYSRQIERRNKLRGMMLNALDFSVMH